MKSAGGVERAARGAARRQEERTRDKEMGKERRAKALSSVDVVALQPGRSP